MELSCPDITKEKKPLVSVVMISYNNERYIDSAIKGVVSQKVPFPIELIISDDASTDTTFERIMMWATRFPHIIRPYRNEVNIGLQANYLRAFGYCRGKYMAMCDADDYWIHRKKLAKQVGYMEQHPQCALTFHRVVNFYEDTGVKSLSNGGQRTDTDIVDLSGRNFITNMSVLYRMDNVDINRLPDFMKEVKLLDYSMHMLVASYGYIHYFKRPMGVYRQYSKGTWSMASDYDRLSMALAVREHLIKHFENDDRRIGDNLRKASTDIARAMVVASGDNQEKRQAAVNRLKAVCPELSVRDIDQSTMENAGKTAISIKRRLLRGARIWLSKCIPVPKP